jgi:hypothetical protein
MINIYDVPARPVPAFRADADKAMLRELVVSTAAQPRRHRPPRLFVLFTVTGVGLAGATAATAYTLLRPQSATVHDNARCYSVVSTDTGGGFPGTTVGAATVAGESTIDSSRIALASCADLWQRGFLTPQGFSAPHASLGPDGLPPANKTVPPLVACVLHSGQAAVYPGDATVCAQLGLPLLSTQ